MPHRKSSIFPLYSSPHLHKNNDQMSAKAPIPLFATLALALISFTGCSTLPFADEDIDTDELTGDEIVALSQSQDAPAGADDLDLDLTDEEVDELPDPDKKRGSVDSDTVVITYDVNGTKRPVVIQLRPDAAPQTVANFKEKILSGEYEGTAVHRVIPRFIVQMGDPLTRSDQDRDRWGTGGNKDTLPPEIKLKHSKGAVAMARIPDASANPSKRSSAYQFYITLGKQARLDGDYTVFGQVTQGLDVIEKISRAVADTNDAPVRRYEIVSTRMVPVNANIEDPGDRKTVGGRTSTVPDSQKTPLTRFIERIW